MRLLAVAILALVPASAASGATVPAAGMPIVNPRADQPASCPATSRYEASRRGLRPGAQKLNELPAADAYAAVYRRIGKCEAPVIVKFGIGGR